MLTSNKRLIGILISIPLLLLIPLIAMQFSSEVNWEPLDFLVMGMLLLGVGLVGEFLLRKVKNSEHRLLLCIGLVVLFLLVWAELAVGIFGTPFAGS